MSQSLTRRQTLRLVIASAAATTLCGLPACSGGSAGPAVFGDVSAGNLSSLPIATLRAVSGAPAIVARDANGVYAMTTTCTHEACDMGNHVSNAGVFCTCHGSKFDVNGGVLAGPATDPLQHFAVTADAAGELAVHGGQAVGASARLKV